MKTFASLAVLAASAAAYWNNPYAGGYSPYARSPYGGYNPYAMYAPRAAAPIVPVAPVI